MKSFLAEFFKGIHGQVLAPPPLAPHPAKFDFWKTLILPSYLRLAKLEIRDSAAHRDKG